MSGSIVEMELDPSHFVMSGMRPRAKVVVGRSPVFTTEERFEGAVLAAATPPNPGFWEAPEEEEEEVEGEK